MTRIILNDQHGPQEIVVGGERKWICRCGLSKTPPFCSGEHKRTLDEKPGKLYQYHEDGRRDETDAS